MGLDINQQKEGMAINLSLSSAINKKTVHFNTPERCANVSELFEKENKNELTFFVILVFPREHKFKISLYLKSIYRAYLTRREKNMT